MVKVQSWSWSWSWEVVDLWLDASPARVSRLRDKARHGSLQLGGLLVPQRGGRCGDHHRARAWAGHEAGDLAVARFGSGAGVDHARPASRAKPPVGGGGDETHAAVALALVVLWAKAPPISERLVALPGGGSEVAVDPLATTEKSHRSRTGVGLQGCPSRRIGEHRAASYPSDVPTGQRRCWPQPVEWAGRGAAARSCAAREGHEQHRSYGNRSQAHGHSRPAHRSDVPVAVTRPAVVIRVAVTTVVLRNATAGRRSRLCRGRRRLCNGRRRRLRCGLRSRLGRGGGCGPTRRR